MTETGIDRRIKVQDTRVNSVVNSVVIGLVAFLLIQLPGIALAETEMVSDTENCLFCHRYPHMGRYDKTGKKRIFYTRQCQC